MITKLEHEVELRRKALREALLTDDQRKIGQARALLAYWEDKAAQPGHMLQGWMGNP